MTLIGFLIVAVVSMIATRIHAPQHLALTAIFLTIGILSAAFVTKLILVEVIVVWAMFYGMERWFPRSKAESEDA